METAASLAGWVPVLARVDDGQLRLELARLGAVRFTRPFFTDTVAPLVQQPFHATFRRVVGLQEAGRWLAANPPLPLGGLIFHVSRCGSTLASQWLGASPRHRVLSEPPPLDVALRGGGAAVGDDERIAWLRATVGLMAQRGDPREERCFVKLDCWHAWHLPLLRRAFPGVPWIFMTRDPVEVIVSHLRMPGAQMVPGMLGLTAPGLDPQTAWSTPREEYIARMLGSICQAALDGLDGHARVVDYSALPGALDAVVAPHFGLRPDADDAALMAVALQRDAKNPAADFQPDTGAKQAEATAAARAAADRWVRPLHDRLAQL